jgi:hypothetical protein
MALGTGSRANALARHDNVRSVEMTTMAILQSHADPKSEAFQANRRDMLALVEEFRALEQRVRETSNA